MYVKDPVARFYADLNLSIDAWQSAASWAEQLEGRREDVAIGAPVIVTDEDEAYLATVTGLTAIGPHLAIHWDRPVPVPPASRSDAALA